MGAKIDPKVEMGLSMFEVGGWKILQLSNRKLFEEFIEETVSVELLIGNSKERFGLRDALRGNITA